MGLLLVSWPVGTAIAGSLIVGKIGKDVIEEKYSDSKLAQFLRNTDKKITQFFDILDNRAKQSFTDIKTKISRNPIKSAAIGVVILFTLPYSAVAAGVVLAGKIIKDIVIPSKQTVKNPQSLQQQNQRQYLDSKKSVPIERTRIYPPAQLQSNNRKSNQQHGL